MHFHFLGGGDKWNANQPNNEMARLELLFTFFNSFIHFAYLKYNACSVIKSAYIFLKARVWHVLLSKGCPNLSIQITMKHL